MDRFLNFKNQALEQKFQTSHDLTLNNSEKLVNIIIGCYLVTFTAKYIAEGFLSPNFKLSTTLVGVAALYGLTLIYILSKCIFKKLQVGKKKTDTAIMLISSLIIILLNNPFRNTKIPCDPSYSMFWNAYEVFVFVLIISSILRRWYLRLCFFAFVSIYFGCLNQETIDDHISGIKILGYIIIVCIVFYFTEKSLRLAYLEKHNQELSTIHILEALPEGILIIDEAFKSLHSNASFTKMFPEFEANNVQNFTQNITHPKPRPFYSHLKSTSVYTKIFLAHQNSRLTLGNTQSAQQPQSLIYDETLTNLNNPTNANTPSGLLAPSSLGKFRFSPKAAAASFFKKGRSDSHESPTASFLETTTPLVSLYSYLKAFFDASRECDDDITVNYKETLEHFYFDTKYEDKTLEISISSLNFSNKKCLLLIFRDKTYSELITKLENSSKYKSLILATVSHELRTPVNSSLHLLNTVLESADVPQSCTENYIKPAKKILVMMLNLINDFLDYSQINEDKLKLVFQPVDIRNVITETLGLIEIQAKKKGISLKLELDPLIPPLFETDPNRFTQILLNLLSNALKFTSQGGIAVSAKIVDTEVPNGQLEVSVRDTGIGIQEEEMKKLFMGYEKIELGENQKLNPNGCGLGLSIANKLAKNLAKRGSSGGIQVDSEVGKGSVFSFTIENKKRKERLSAKYQKNIRSSFSRQSKITSPKNIRRLSETSDESFHDIMEIIEGEYPIYKRWPKQPLFRGSSKQAPISDGEDLSQENSNYLVVSNKNFENKFPKCNCPDILVVDDDAFNHLTLENLIKPFGLTSKSCFNGDEAIKEVIRRSESKGCCSDKCQSFSVIFMDCNMPIKNGLEATKEIKTFLKEKGMNSVPIVGLSAHSEEIAGQDSFAAGMDYFLTKPATLNKVKEILWEVEKKD